MDESTIVEIVVVEKLVVGVLLGWLNVVVVVVVVDANSVAFVVVESENEMLLFSWL